jgi:putative FmdB family regulatory protein
MPIYEYACDSCGYRFERIQSFNDDPVTECPACEGSVRRVISPVGVIFKGSGWYITDNRRQISGTKAPALSEKQDTKKAKASPEKASTDGAKSDGGGDGSAPKGEKAPSKQGNG